MLRRGRAPAADPQTTALLKRLESVVSQAPELAEPAALYRAILPRLRAAQLAQAALSPPGIDLETARRKLAAGLPHLVGEELAFDAQAAAELFVELCRAVEAAGAGSIDDNTEAAAQIRRAAKRGELDLVAMWQALASGDDLRLGDLAAAAGLDPALLRVLGQNSLKPALRAFAEGPGRGLDLDGWQRRVCPICGSPPLLAEVQGEEGARQLRCGMCGAGWSYPRLQCALCGSTNHRLLGYILVEGEAEKYRVQTCDVCHGYIKVVTTFDPTPVDLLSVEDLATLDLDSIAAERGYARAPVKA
jgi:FdhE protein